jgi:hypothetical protein
MGLSPEKAWPRFGMNRRLCPSSHPLFHLNVRDKPIPKSLPSGLINISYSRNIHNALDIGNHLLLCARRDCYRGVSW